MISNYKNEPKSQNDCFMKYLQKKEFQKCKCNRKWFYSKLIDFNTTLCGQKLCEIKTNKVFLNKICKKDCFNEYYTNKMISKDSINRWNNRFVNPFILLFKNFEKEVIYIHLPKYDFITYICSFASLAAMYFGINLFQLISGLIIKSISYFQSFQNILNGNINYFKVKQISKFIIMLLFIILMSLQTIEIFLNYINAEIITRMSIIENINIPKIQIKFEMGTNVEFNYIINNKRYKE
jgi:hypothetical protein